ncbi:MAG TPA: PAS domain S-box protein [Nitrospirota bacterium]|nr:PAS domain S-box protein [Nitrospirota bacterium]
MSYKGCIFVKDFLGQIMRAKMAKRADSQKTFIESHLKLTPLRITILYAVLGGLWVFQSDSFLNAIVHNPNTLTQISIIKGWVYVAVTAYILFLLIRHFEKTHLTSENQYRELLEQASDGIIIFNKQGNLLTVNEQECKMLGYTEKEFLKMNLREFFPPEDLIVTPLRFEEVLAGKTILSERRIRRKDGTLFPAEISGKMLKNGLFLAITRDVSEHRQKDEILARRSRQLELLLSSIRQINTVLEIPVVMRAIIETALALTGATSGVAGIMQNGKMVFREYNQRGKLISFEHVYESGLGIPGWIMRTGKPYISNDAQSDVVVTPEVREKLGFYNFAGVPIFSRNGNLLGCFIIHDMADRTPFTDHHIEILEGLAAGAAVAMENAQLLAKHKRVEASLREGAKKFRMLTETVAAAIIIYQGKSLRYFNATTEKMTGYSPNELLHMNIMSLVHPDYRQMVNERSSALWRSKKHSSRYECKIVTKAGDERWVDFTSATIEFEGRPAALGTAYDITERKKLEEQFRQSHKMEAVGLLAGGVAHDFNNILTAIIGYGNLVKMKLAANDLVHNYVDQILSSSERAANLTHSLLAFSRKQIINPQPVNVNDIIVGIGKLLDRLIGEDIEFKIDLEGRALVVLADAGQLEQVFMNLATNARDAMIEGGTLTIKTKRVALDQNFITRHGYGSVGNFALITVTDSGSGMDGMTQARIFEPFFTTKEMGKGTGLGLSMVYGIVKQHDGYIAVSSAPGIGTTFEIYFPLVQSSVNETASAKTADTLGGTETVLVAEDDEAVRNLTMTVLAESGYTVIGVSDGELALAKFIENKSRIRLLIFDVIMPKMNGKDAYEEIRKFRPNIKVLFMSGYAADIFEEKNISGKDLKIIAKPIAPTEFLKKVRETLDS